MRIPLLTKYIEKIIVERTSSDHKLIENNTVSINDQALERKRQIGHLQGQLDGKTVRWGDYTGCQADTVASFERKFASLTMRMNNSEKGEKYIAQTFKQVWAALHARQRASEELVDLAVSNIETIGDVQNDLADLRENHGNTLYKLNKTVKGLGELYRSKNEKPKQLKQAKPNK